MEVSSHALHQSRVYGIDFSAAVFTNLTQDHLDYHGSMEEYFRAKRLLFDGLPAAVPAVVNADDPWGQVLARERHGAVITYGFRPGSTVTVRDSAVTLDGTTLTVTADGAPVEVRSALVGKFNVYNIVAAFAAGYALRTPLEAIVSGIGKLSAVRGRFERIRSPRGWTAIVDYAHTPDALENCLRTIRALLPGDRPGRVITVFGAGGDRDRTKRPVMGAVAASLSDVLILTSDNPRSEDPLSIMKEIAAGIPPQVSYDMEVDRRRAIVQALQHAQPGDVVLVAGKGHEDYQIIKSERFHFSDREIIEQFL
jgi:UDP-N-acetylmuramyl-tripeptide synthetase